MSLWHNIINLDDGDRLNFIHCNFHRERRPTNLCRHLWPKVRRVGVRGNRHKCGLRWSLCGTSAPISPPASPATTRCPRTKPRASFESCCHLLSCTCTMINRCVIGYAGAWNELDQKVFKFMIKCLFMSIMYYYTTLLLFFFISKQQTNLINHLTE